MMTARVAMMMNLLGMVAVLHFAAAAARGADAEAVRVETVEQLLHAIESARPGATILIADGRYRMPRYTEITADRVTLRSESGEREAVILDGSESRHHELIGIRDASYVTIADLTIQNVVANGIKINNDTPVHHVTIQNCVIRNVWQRGVKSVRSPELKTRNGVIEGCLFVNDRPKRYEDDPHDTADNFDGNYVGAIDLMDAVGWRIRDNVFRDIQGRTRMGRGAIFIWFESENCIIERNTIIDCDQGIALGNAHKPDGTAYHVSGFVVRNNMITRAPMNPIFIASSRRTRVLHNTVHDPANERHRSVRIFGENDGLHFTANLINGSAIRTEHVDGEVTIEANVVADTLSGFFVDAEAGDLRLSREGAEELPTVAASLHAPHDIRHAQRPEPTYPGAYHAFEEDGL